MLITSVLTKANELRPNVLSEGIKVEWIYELDGEFAEMMGVEPPVNEWETDTASADYAARKAAAETLISYPHDECYVLYLCAKIDNALEETALYQNDYFMANQAIAETKAWYRRNNRPDRRYGVKI